MSSRFGIGLYTLRTRPVRTDEWPPSIYGGAHDMFGLLRGYFEDRLGNLINLRDYRQTTESRAREFRTLRVTVCHLNRNDRSMSGTIECGEFGLSHPLMNITNGRESFRRTRNDSDHHPYFFRIQIPDGCTKAVMALLRIGARSPKSTIAEDMKKYMHGLDKLLEIRELADRRVLTQYLTNGTVNAIRVKTYKSRNDQRAILNRSRIRGEPIEEGAEVTVSVKYRDGFEGVANRLLSVVNGDREIQSIVEINGLSNPDETFVDVEYGGKQRTFNITHPDNAGISADVPPAVTVDDNGYPRFDLVNRFAKELCDEFEEVIHED